MSVDIPKGFSVVKVGKINYELFRNKTARVVRSPEADGFVTLPVFVEVDGVQYSIREISRKAFSRTNLRSLTLPDNSEVTYIGWHAFYESKIVRLSISPSCRTLESGWCEGTRRLIIVEIPLKNSFFTIHNNSLYTTNLKELVWVPRDVKSFEVPEKVIAIRPYCFNYCMELKELRLNNNLKTICECAIYFTGLDNIKIPASVRVIEKSALACNFALEKVTFEKNGELERIEPYAFCGAAIKSIELPRFIQSIKQNAFRSCLNLQDVTIFGPDTLDIRDGAFDGIAPYYVAKCNKGRKLTGKGVPDGSHLLLVDEEVEEVIRNQELIDLYKSVMYKANDREWIVDIPFDDALQHERRILNFGDNFDGSITLHEVEVVEKRVVKTVESKETVVTEQRKLVITSEQAPPPAAAEQAPPPPPAEQPKESKKKDSKKKDKKKDSKKDDKKKDKKKKSKKNEDDEYGSDEYYYEDSGEYYDSSDEEEDDSSSSDEMDKSSSDSMDKSSSDEMDKSDED